MRRTLVILLAAAAVAFAAAWLWLWWNKDRYQLVHYPVGHQGKVSVSVFDRNTGEVVRQLPP